MTRGALAAPQISGGLIVMANLSTIVLMPRFGTSGRRVR
jgi:hypothetical protein